MKKWVIASLFACPILLLSGCAQTALSQASLTPAQIATCSPYVVNTGDALYKAGKAAYFRRDYARAATCYQFAARHGNSRAQFELGQMYEEGETVERNMEVAVRWYTQAAEAGNTDAQFTLGVLYATGQGVAQDKSQAVYWQKKAAEAGNIYAQTSLGIMYGTGQGVEKDYVKAYAWFTLAADKGFPLAREKQIQIRKLLDANALGDASKLAFEMRQSLPVQREVHQNRYFLHVSD